MRRTELEELVKEQMHYITKAPCCGSCRCYQSQTDNEGAKCTANIAVQFFTTQDAWCTFYKKKHVDVVKASV